MPENKEYKALVVEEHENGDFSRAIKNCMVKDLPQGDVLIKVSYSSLNYKDALSASGNKGVTRKYPHTPGIDACGIVEKSDSEKFSPGDKVIVTSYDLGMNTSGGFGEYIRVPSEWIVPLPDEMSLKESMIYGTAGFTAALSILKLTEHGITPDMGTILVTGASGGVGSLAVLILKKIGYTVTGVCGPNDEKEHIKSLGAENALTSEEFIQDGKSPLLKAQWAGVIETVGGQVLETAIKSANQHSIITSCGNILSPKINLTVFPFIIRGVTLAGIDSQSCPMDYRAKTWNLLAKEWKIPEFEKITKEINLDQLEDEIQIMLEGKGKGRKILSHMI
ncbi:MAG: oxidoreductase [Deltaproteobacteria bacterium]|nr:MAG: oxidoreductase [Deltaproteobacteria bacterium]